jgi:hypothetical protein
MSICETLINYILIGFTHVLPYGYDHILFIMSLYFFNVSSKTIFIQCSVFTLAHSLTLVLSTYGLITVSSSFIEPLIAVTILITSLENILHNSVNTWRLCFVFLFGLLHGLGFANALQKIGINQANFKISLLAFNIGVELGQITVVIMVYVLIVKWFKNKIWFKERVVYPISSVIGCVALYWTISRFLGIG